MKKRILFVIMAVSILIITTGCNSLNDSIVGTWKRTDKTDISVFKADGTFLSEKGYFTTEIFSHDVVYELKDNNIVTFNDRGDDYKFYYRYEIVKQGKEIKMTLYMVPFIEDSYKTDQISEEIKAEFIKESNDEKEIETKYF